MKKLLVGLIGLFVLTGCEPSTKEVSGQYRLPNELGDCKVYQLRAEHGGRLTVLRCPNTTTATTEVQGKTTVETVVIDGVEYIKATKETN